VPIVFVQVTDPVGGGFVESLARPGGNTTGFTLFEYSTIGKWLEWPLLGRFETSGNRPRASGRPSRWERPPGGYWRVSRTAWACGVPSVPPNPMDGLAGYLRASPAGSAVARRAGRWREGCGRDHGDIGGLSRTHQPQTRHARKQGGEPVGQLRVLDDEGQPDRRGAGSALKRRASRRWSARPAWSHRPRGSRAGRARGSPASPRHVQWSPTGEGSQFRAVRHTSSINNASILVLRNVTIASAGVQTIGSLSLKDVLMTTGTPVRAKKHDISS
jgi:hypothetical protein